MAKKKNQSVIASLIKDSFFLSLLILILLGGTLFYFKSAPKREEESVQPWLANKKDLIQKIVIKRPGEEITLQKKEGSWFVLDENKEEQEADQEKVDSLLEKLTRVKRTELVSNNEKSHPKYGLGKDQAIELRVYQDENLLLHLLVGDPGPDFESNYVTIGEGKEVYLTSLSLRSVLIQPRWTPPDTEEVSPTTFPSD